MKGLGTIIGFLVGAVGGSVVSYTMAKDKYLKRADDEIASMKQYYEDKANKAIREADEAKKRAAEAADNADLYMKNMEKMAAENHKLRNGTAYSLRESSENTDDKEGDLETLQTLIKKNKYHF